MLKLRSKRSKRSTRLNPSTIASTGASGEITNTVAAAKQIDCSICLVCDDTIQSRNEIKLYSSCGHKTNFCSVCMGSYVQSKIDQHSVKTLLCPFPQCNELLPLEVIRSAVNEDYYKKYEKDRLSLQNYERTADNGLIIFSHIQALFRELYFFILLLFRRSACDSQRCPKCRYIIEKDGGCDHMRCTRCAHEFYWCCRQDYGCHNNQLCSTIQFSLRGFKVAMLSFSLLLTGYILGIHKLVYSCYQLAMVCYATMPSISDSLIVVMSSASEMLTQSTLLKAYASDAFGALVRTFFGSYFLLLCQGNKMRIEDSGSRRFCGVLGALLLGTIFFSEMKRTYLASLIVFVPHLSPCQNHWILGTASVVATVMLLLMQMDQLDPYVSQVSTLLGVGALYTTVVSCIASPFVVLCCERWIPVNNIQDWVLKLLLVVCAHGFSVPSGILAVIHFVITCGPCGSRWMNRVQKTIDTFYSYHDSPMCFGSLSFTLFHWALRLMDWMEQWPSFEGIVWWTFLPTYWQVFYIARVACFAYVLEYTFDKHRYNYNSMREYIWALGAIWLAQDSILCVLGTVVVLIPTVFACCCGSGPGHPEDIDWLYMALLGQSVGVYIFFEQSVVTGVHIFTVLGVCSQYSTILWGVGCVGTLVGAVAMYSLIL